jgi:hypothetical protein
MKSCSSRRKEALIWLGFLIFSTEPYVVSYNLTERK